MDTLARQLRMVTRKLVRSPMFTALSVVTLAIGIGANSAIFSVVNGVLLRPLPFSEPERLVGVWNTGPGIDLPQFEQSAASYLLYRQENRFFEELGIYDESTVNLTGVETPERLVSADVTASTFSVLKVAPALGRTFEEGDERPGAKPVVVLSHALWRSRFGADPDILGRRLWIDGVAREVIGLMPAGFRFPTPQTQLWVPMEIDPLEPNVGDFSFPGIARLKPGATVAAAEADLSALIHRLPEVFPDEQITVDLMKNARIAALVHPLSDDVVGDVGPVLWLLFGAVGFLLLIACANVANLFLARADGRQREVAVRTALGAHRGHLISESLAESLVLALVGGVGGLVLATLGLRVLLAIGPESIPRLEEIGVDGNVLAFTAAISLLVGLVFGVFPALRARPQLGPALKEGGRRTTAGRTRHRARNVLVVTQIALALMLLTGAGLMIRSVRALRAVDPGFAARGVLTMRLTLPAAQYPTVDETVAFYSEALGRIRALPGVEAAGAVTRLPLARGGSNSGHEFEDFPLGPDDVPRIISTRRAAPGYFQALRIPLIEGRVFDDADHQNRSRVALVSQALASHLWGEASALGKRLTSGQAAQGDWYTIVGVVGSIHDDGLEHEPTEMIYFPLVNPPARADEDASAPRSMNLVVRTGGRASALAASVRSTIWSLDPELPIASVRTLEQILERSRARTSFTMLLLLIASTVALLLGAVGLYGVVSYVVSQRTQEIGVRMALGADRGSVSWLVLRQGLGLSVVGIAAGLVGAFGLTHFLESLLFRVDATDLTTFVAVSMLLLAITLFASYLPARRAAIVDPLTALRYE